MHPDIWGKYRIEFQKRFVSRGFRFNPLTMQDDSVRCFRRAAWLVLHRVPD